MVSLDMLTILVGLLPLFSVHLGLLTQPRLFRVSHTALSYFLRGVGHSISASTYISESSCSILFFSGLSLALHSASLTSDGYQTLLRG